MMLSTIMKRPTPRFRKRIIPPQPTIDITRLWQWPGHSSQQPSTFRAFKLQCRSRIKTYRVPIYHLKTNLKSHTRINNKLIKKDNFKIIGRKLKKHTPSTLATLSKEIAHSLVPLKAIRGSNQLMIKKSRSSDFMI